MKRKGILIVVSGFSGAGKGTLMKKLMEEYDKLFPGYDFASNKGYGSKEHIEALHRLGPCPIHRRSFLKNICGE